MITAAVSAMLVSSNRNTLRNLQVDCPLTEEARQAVCNLPNLCGLELVIEKDSLLPTVVLPNLTKLDIKYNHDHSWLQGFHGVTLRKLAWVKFHTECKSIGDFLEAFERVALPASIQDALSEFRFYTSRAWIPNYSSLLSFTQLTHLDIEFSCDGGCPSRVDDNVIMDLARTMQKLETLRLGDPPCHNFPTGVTTKGLMVLGHHCLGLHTLCIHFKVDSLCVPPANPGVAPGTGSTAPQRDCGLLYLEVGDIPLPEESVSTVALTLAHIFPHIEDITSVGENWDKVLDAICNSREIINHSSEEHPFPPPGATLVTLPQKPYLGTPSDPESSNFAPTVAPLPALPDSHTCSFV